jgi:hypothetical protein
MPNGCAVGRATGPWPFGNIYLPIWYQAKDVVVHYIEQLKRTCGLYVTLYLSGFSEHSLLL